MKRNDICTCGHYRKDHHLCFFECQDKSCRCNHFSKIENPSDQLGRLLFHVVNYSEKEISPFAFNVLMKRSEQNYWLEKIRDDSQGKLALDPIVIMDKKFVVAIDRSLTSDRYIVVDRIEFATLADDSRPYVKVGLKPS